MAQSFVSDLGEVFDVVIRELRAKLAQVELVVRLEKAASRNVLAIYCWETGRVIRKLVDPDSATDRKIFWHECQGILKDVLLFPGWDAGEFCDHGVRQDILAQDLLAMLRKLLGYVEKRASGQVKAPREKVSLEDAMRAREERKRQAEAKPLRVRVCDLLDKSNRRRVRARATCRAIKKRWDEEFSDPDELCPEIVRFGSCTYGHQCGFCFR